MSNPDHLESQASTSFFRDRSFWGLTISQLLGAFNDNMFKQLVLLLCLEKAHEVAQETGGEVSDWYQPIAMAIFAMPWILCSGVSGYLADRISKRRIVVLCKSLEIFVMGCGLLAFLSDELWALLIVLFLMSMQSTIFGPAKFGILPEQFRSEDLPSINGIFQMTTFLAIIFGFASAGILKEALPGQEGLAWVSVLSIGIAIVGTGAACLVRPTPVAQPDLKLTWQAAGIDGDNWRLLKNNRFLLGVLLVSALFWFVGGVVQASVNSMGKHDLHLSDDRIGILQACMGVGIAFGCVMSGRLSQKRVRFGVVRAGMFGMVVGFPVLTAIAYFHAGTPALATETTIVAADSDHLLFDAATGEWWARGCLIWLGACAGFFAVPLQVALQSVPPQSQKGRMIGTMNLVNWIGILLSAAFYAIFEFARMKLNKQGLELNFATVFSALAVIAAVVVMIYKPDDIDLTEPAK